MHCLSLWPYLYQIGLFAYYPHLKASEWMVVLLGVVWPCAWIWSSVCKWDNDELVPSGSTCCIHLRCAQQAAVVNSALWDSGPWASAVVTEPIAGRVQKFQSTFYIWLLCSGSLDLFVIKSAFTLRQGVWISEPLLALGSSLQRQRFGEGVWAPATAPPELRAAPGAAVCLGSVLDFGTARQVWVSARECDWLEAALVVFGSLEALQLHRNQFLLWNYQRYVSILKKPKVRFCCHPLSPGAGVWWRQSWDSSQQCRVWAECFGTALATGAATGLGLDWELQINS